jgi:primosomal protein N''
MLSNFHEQMQSLRTAFQQNGYAQQNASANQSYVSELRSTIGQLINAIHDGDTDTAAYLAEDIESGINHLCDSSTNCERISNNLQSAWQVMYGDHYGTIDN